MNSFTYFIKKNHTRETMKLSMKHQPPCPTKGSSLSWAIPNKTLKQRDVTPLRWSCCSFLSTYLRVQLRLLSHATHAQRRARLWLPTWSSDAQSEKANPNARKAAWRALPNSRLSLCDRARWMAARRGPLQTGKNSRKTPAAAAASAVAGWEGSPHLSRCQPRPGPVTIPWLQSDF